MADEGVTAPAAEKPRLRDESLEALLGRAIGNVRRNRQYFVVGAVVLLVAMLNHPSVNRGLPVAAPAGVSTGAPAADASAAAPAATPASSADALAASAGTSQVAAAITPYSPPPDSSSVAGSPPSSGGDSPPPASSPPPQSAPPSYTCSSDSGMPAPAAGTAVNGVASAQSQLQQSSGQQAPADAAATVAGPAGCSNGSQSAAYAANIPAITNLVLGFRGL